jgi:hypothetical protein
MKDRIVKQELIDIETSGRGRVNGKNKRDEYG